MMLLNRKGIASLMLMTGPFLWAQASRPTNNPIARLDRKLAEGGTKLDYRSDGWSYLAGVLQQLDINRDSQILVFSKTSFQQDLISPAAPRALYFNDDVILGAVQNAAVMELVSVDPTQGLKFYTLTQRKAEEPRFRPQFASCAFCHGAINRWAQGVMVATVFLPRTECRSFQKVEEFSS